MLVHTLEEEEDIEIVARALGDGPS